MINLRQALADYLALRRSLGYKLDRDGKLLAQFLDWLDGQGKHTVTLTDTLEWVHLPVAPSTSWLRMRLQALRGFAIYLHSLDSTVEVPPPGLVPGPVPRAVPYLYSDADIAALLNQAERLSHPLRRATMRTLIGLLAVTGMRLGEVLGLDDTDVDPAQVAAAKGRTDRLGGLRRIGIDEIAYKKVIWSSSSGVLDVQHGLVPRWDLRGGCGYLSLVQLVDHVGGASACSARGDVRVPGAVVDRPGRRRRPHRTD